MHRRTFSDAARHYRRWRLASAPTRGGATVDLNVALLSQLTRGAGSAISARWLCSTCSFSMSDLLMF